MEVRAKDKIFMAVFIPIAIGAAYAWFWRIDASKAMVALEAEHDRLVAVEDFPLEERIRKARLADAERELEDERATAPAEPKVVADAVASVALREREVMKVFSDAGLAVMRCEAVAAKRSCISPEALAATGLCPTPVCRRYTLDGSYPAVKRALDAFCRTRSAAIPDSLSMRSTGFARWTVEVWL